MRTPPSVDAAAPVPLSVLILTCGEAPAVLERTLAAAAPLTAEADVTLVANAASTRDDEALAAVARRHGAGFLRLPHLGSKARVMSLLIARCKRPLVAFLDADEAPDPDVLLHLARLLAAEPPDVAFVQGFNASSHRCWWQRCEVARLEVYRQVVCRARDAVGRVHFLGTTAVHRTAALRAVGIPDWSVTEDNALSAVLHFSGWRSRFHPVTCTRGLPCATIVAWWRQQRRWSHGNLTVLRWVLARALREPPRDRAEAALLGGYLISGAFFAASTLWSLVLLGTIAAVAAGALPPLALAGHLIWLLLVTGLLPGPRPLSTALLLVAGNLAVLPGYLSGCARALLTRDRLFDVSDKDTRQLVP